MHCKACDDPLDEEVYTLSGQDDLCLKCFGISNKYVDEWYQDE